MARHKGSVSQALRAGPGVIAGAAARAIKPGLEIVGVQTTRFPAMFNAFKGTQHPQGSSCIAEGIAVGTPGRITQEILARLVDDMLLLDEGNIAQTSVMLLEIEKNAGRRRGRCRAGGAAQIPRMLQR